MMPRTLARCLLSAALILAVVASARRADAKPTKLGDATAADLAAQSRPKAAAPAQPQPQAKAKAAPAPAKAAAPAAPRTIAKAKPPATPKAKAKLKPKADAKPKSDQKIKAVTPKTKPVPARPNGPATPTPTPLARA
jgi:hypothetical protein